MWSETLLVLLVFLAIQHNSPWNPSLSRNLGKSVVPILPGRSIPEVDMEVVGWDQYYSVLVYIPHPSMPF